MKELKDKATNLLRRLSESDVNEKGRNHFITKEESETLRLLLCNLKYLAQIEEIDLSRDYYYNNTRFEFGNECPKIETTKFKENKNVNNAT